MSNSPPYQGGREFDDALLEQLDVLPEFVAACGFHNAKAPGFEADDFLAAAAAKEEKLGGTVLIAEAGDRDTFQLASDRTTILYPVRAGEMARIDPAEVRAPTTALEPKQVPDFIALRGDPSDKVPGAPGVGATGAANLLQRYGSLEVALAAGRFPAMADSLRLYRSIATMNKPAPLPSLRNQTPNWHKAAALAREWELNQLASRLEELADGGRTSERTRTKSSVKRSLGTAATAPQENDLGVMELDAVYYDRRFCRRGREGKHLDSRGAYGYRNDLRLELHHSLRCTRAAMPRLILDSFPPFSFGAAPACG